MSPHYSVVVPVFEDNSAAFVTRVSKVMMD
jgi:hypothetical protein